MTQFDNEQLAHAVVAFELPVLSIPIEAHGLYQAFAPHVVNVKDHNNAAGRDSCS